MTVERSYDVGPECLISVESTSGNLEISSWDAQQIGVACPEESCHVSQHGREMHVLSLAGGSEDVRLRVPSHCDLALHTTSGQIELRGVEGTLQVQSRSGNVTAEHLRGTLALDTVSGDIRALGLQGALRCQTVSGSVELQASATQVLDVETVSGDCYLETGLAEGGDYRLRGVSGDLQLALPSEQRCTIQHHTLSGSVRCDLPHEIRQHGWGRQEVLVNGGGLELQVRTASGDLSLKAAEHLQGIQPEPMATERLVHEEGEAEPEPFALDDMPTPPPSQEADSASQRMRILRSIEAGSMTVEEGLERLRALG